MSTGLMRRLGRFFVLSIVLATLACGPSKTSPSGTCTLMSSALANAGDTVKLPFAVPPSSVADVLSYEVDYLPNPLSSGWSLSCQLFDGSQLLGTGPCGAWQSLTAAFPLPGVSTLDFSPIAAGISAGHIDFIVSGGSWSFDSKGSVSLGRTISTPGGSSVAFVAAGTTSPLQLISGSCR